LGFQFIPINEFFAPYRESIDGRAIAPVRRKVMALTGLSDGDVSIGTKDNNIFVVHSSYYHSNGNYLGILASSDSSLKTNIRDLMPVSERIAQLRPVIYDFIVDNNSDGEIIPDASAKSNSKGNGNNGNNGNGNNGNNGNGNNGNGNNGNGNNNNNNGNNDENQKDRVGFLAQEVLPLFPDLVVMDADSSLRLDYAGLIPYLTKAIQEQTEIVQEQAAAIETQNNTIQEQRTIIEFQNTALEHQNKKIERLEQRISEVQMGVSYASFIILDDESQQYTQSAQTTEESESQIYKSSQINKTGNVLYQNTPNPFNLSTTIKYQLSDNAANAKICIYNLTGKQLQCYNLQATRGENSIEVRASSLQSGMYLYSLIVDDKLVSTKRMILTE
jgi:hypothetical protein